MRRAQVIAIAERHLREAQAEIRRLLRFRMELAGALRRWKRMPARSVTGDAICELIERTIDDNHWKNAALNKADRRNGSR